MEYLYTPRYCYISPLCFTAQRTREIVPVTFDLARGLVHPPTPPHRALAARKRLFPQGTVLHAPALERRVVDRDPTLLQQLCDMPIAQRVGDIPAHAHAKDVLGNMGPFEADRHRRSPSLCTWRHRGRAYPKSTHMKFATKLPCPQGGDITKNENGDPVAGIYKATRKRCPSSGPRSQSELL